MAESVPLCCGYVLTTNNLQLGSQFIICNYFILQFSLKLAAVTAVPSCLFGGRVVPLPSIASVGWVKREAVRAPRIDTAQTASVPNWASGVGIWVVQSTPSDIQADLYIGFFLSVSWLWNTLVLLTVSKTSSCSYTTKHKAIRLRGKGLQPECFLKKMGEKKTCKKCTVRCEGK